MGDEVAALCALLSDGERSRSLDELLLTNGLGLKTPGMYSWWVDRAGAEDLTVGLGHRVDPGLIYAGLAGATRKKSGKSSTNTVWSRIKTMHLGRNHNLSTLRWSIGSVLAEGSGHQGVDEASLTKWMMEHLRVVTIAGLDPLTLDDVETDVLRSLNPPLNLAKVERTELRTTLSALRKRHK